MNTADRTYQLHILVSRPLLLVVGRLGVIDFPPGLYVYTGSARRNLDARVKRHLRRDKRLRWHIDYLLAGQGVRIVEVVRSSLEECRLNQDTGGAIVAPGFGSSDCRHGCGSHLKYLGRGA